MAVSDALDVLKRHGYKYTRKREVMLEILMRESRYVNAKFVYQQMQHEFPRLSFDTVYRNLGLLSELNIVEVTQWNDERLYRLCRDRDSHHHHLICTKCGKSRTIDVCPMKMLPASPEGYYITDHKFEVYGVCQDCAL